MIPRSSYTCQINYKTKNNERHNTNIINLTSKPKPSSSDINLIDLLSQVHITPQKTHDNDKDKQIADYQLKMLEEFCRTSTLLKQHSELEDAEFRSFCDKYEHSTQPKTSEPQAILNYEVLRAFEQTESNQFDDNLCVLNSRQFAEVIDADGMLEPDKELELEDGEIKLNEDLIDEIIFEQHLEKQQLKDISPKTNESFGFDETPRKLISSIDSKMPKADYNSILNEIVTKNQVKYFKTLPANNNHFSTVKSKNPSSMISEHGKDYTIKTETKLDQKALTEELVTKYDVKYLEAIKKIEKTFQKRSILKSDAEKAKLTPGPSLYEKTVILPQMMQRLNARNNDMEDTSMKIKFILDAGPSCTSSASSQNTIQNCVRTTSVKQPQNILKSNGLTYDAEPHIDHSSGCSSVKGCPIPAVLKNQNSKAALKNINIPNIKSIKKAIEKPVFMSQCIKTAIEKPVSSSQSIKTVTEKPSIKNVQETPGFNMQSIRNAITPVSEDILDSITVLRPPEVLMSDCNKQRYIASEAGKLFNNFVRSGTYYAP